MNKKLLRSVREYKKQTVLAPVLVILEVLMEVLIPLEMAKIIDVGIANGDMSYIIQRGVILVAMAMLSLFFGVQAGNMAAVAAAGYAKNLRHDIFYKVQDFSFKNIDHFSTSGLVTRLTTAQADKVLFTGMIDEFYDYCYGELEYRSLKFETEVLDMGNYQGNAVVNYTDYEVPYTRIIEHKHFEFGTQPKTVITREYPAAWEKGKEPYYPVNDPKNSELFDKYERRALEEKNVIFGGRLGMYRYMDMDQVIEEALSLAETELTYEEP